MKPAHLLPLALGFVHAAAYAADPQGQAQTQVKETLGPHGLTVQSQLETALDQIRGVQALYEIKQPPTKEAMNHIRIHEKELSQAMSLATEHQGHLDKNVSKFPGVAQSDQYRSERAAMNELQQLNRSWSDKASKKAYWKNADQVRADLDRLESRLDTTIARTRSLNSSQFDLTAG
jgi:hypothetical protein